MKYKLVAVDFDDTLLRSDLTISDYSIEVIKKYVADGGIFTIATGRMYSALLNWLPMLPINAPLITCQGSYVVDNKTGKVLFNNSIDVALAAKILKYVEDLGFYTQIYYEDNMYVNYVTKQTLWYEKVGGIKARVAGKQLSEYIVDNNYCPNKLLIMTDSKEITDKLVTLLGRQFDSGIAINVSKPTFIEIVNCNATKADGVDYVAKMHGLTASDCMTVGDSLNDLNMIVYAGMGVAVGNAVQQVKSSATDVVETNDKDGVAQAILKHCYADKE